METVILFVVGLLGFLHLRGRIIALESRSGVAPLVAHRDAVRSASSAVSEEELSALAMQNVPPEVAPAPELAPLPASPGQTEERSARFMGKIGILMVFLGVVFFLKYAFDENWISPAGQVAIGILFGLAFVIVGMKLRSKYQLYSDVLLGGGIGILYLAIYAGYAFYTPRVIEVEVTFFLMTLITAFGLFLATVSRAPALAVIAILGGFLTPILLSTNSGNIHVLAPYMIVLNIGVLVVAIFRKWSALNYLTFFCTVLLFGSWFAGNNTPAFLGVNFFYASVFFLLFLATSLFHHLMRQESSRTGDHALILFNAMGYFAICHAIFYTDYRFLEGFFAVLLAVFYLALSVLALKRNPEERQLNFLLPGIGVAFLTIAVPLQLTGYWVTFAWLIEGLLLMSFALRGRMNGLLVMGWFVLILGFIRSLYDMGVIRSEHISQGDYVAFFNLAFFMLIVDVVTLYVVAGMFARGKEWLSQAMKVVGALVIIANIATVSGITAEIYAIYDARVQVVRTEASEKARTQVNYYGNGGENTVGVYELNNYGYNYNYGYDSITQQEVTRLTNMRNTIISIFWALYATLLIIIGFAGRIRFIRILGLVFIFFTVFKVFADLWQFGRIYQIIVSTLIGLILLGASFLYAKYKDRLTSLIAS